MSFNVPSLARRLDVVPAAVGVIVALPFDHGFLAVEEEELDRELILTVLQHPGQLDQERRARPAVVGADEIELLEPLRVVVSGEDEPPVVRIAARELRAQVDELRFPQGRFGGEGLLVDGQPDGLQLAW